VIITRIIENEDAILLCVWKASRLFVVSIVDVVWVSEHVGEVFRVRGADFRPHLTSDGATLPSTLLPLCRLWRMLGWHSLHC